MADVSYVDGLQLWVWDTDQLEGFTVYLNQEILDTQIIEGLKYNIAKPTGTANLVIEFAGVDGGATRVVDTKANKVLASQETGNRHVYDVKG